QGVPVDVLLCFDLEARSIPIARLYVAHGLRGLQRGCPVLLLCVGEGALVLPVALSDQPGGFGGAGIGVLVAGSSGVAGLGFVPLLPGGRLLGLAVAVLHG